MHSIPLHLKLILFEKGKDEVLTPEEQEIWEEFIASEQPQQIPAIPDEGLFSEALELYLRLKDEQIATWEKFEETVLQHDDHLPVVQPAPPVRKFFKRTIWIIIVAAILLCLLFISQMYYRSP